MNEGLTPINCPFFGLQPAAESDAKYFFGRENERQIVKMNLYAEPLTVVYGASGVGKSSLLLAGVLPQLRKPKQAAVVFRQYQESDIAGSLKLAVLEAVRQCTQGDADIDPSLPLDEFLLRCNRALRGPIFLIFDQFEDYFLHHPPSAAADAFEEQFARAVNRPDIDVHLLLSLRDDRVSHLDRFQGRIDSFQNMLRVEHMTRAGAEEAISRPLENYNELQEPGRRVSIEPELVTTLMDDVSKGQVAFGAKGGQTGERVDAPSLQLALITLWAEEAAADSRVLRLDTYQRLGRAERIVGSYLDRIMSEFGDTDRRLAAHMFRYLVTPTGIKVAHTKEDLATYTGESVADVGRVLDMLSAPGVRVLQPVAGLPDQPDVTRYEIFHDVLGPAVLEWQGRYREEEVLIRVTELREIERAKRLRLIVVGMAVALAALSGVTIFAFRQRGEAQRQRGEAVRQKAIAVEGRKKAELLRKEAEQQRAEAQKSAVDARESAAKARKANERSEQSLNAETLAKAEAERRAKEADDERRRAEDALTQTRTAKDEAVRLRGVAERAKDEAVRLRGVAERAKEDAERKAIVAVDALEVAKKAQKDAEVARQSERAAREAADESAKQATTATTLVKQIDQTTPFSGGVIRNPDPLLNVTLSPDLSSIVTSDGLGRVFSWNTTNVTTLSQDQLTAKRGEAAPNLPIKGGMRINALSSDGRLAAVAESGTVYVWEPNPGPRSDASPQPLQPVRALKMPAGASGKEINSLAVASVGGRKFVAAGYRRRDREVVAADYRSGLLAVWRLDKCDAERVGCEPLEADAHKDIINSIAFSPDARFIATASGVGPGRNEVAEDCKVIKGNDQKSNDNTAKVWEMSWADGGGGSLAEIKTLKGHDCRVNSVAFNNPGSNPKKMLRVVTAGEDGIVKRYNVLRLKPDTVKGYELADSNTYTLDVYEAPRIRHWLLRQPIRKVFSLSVGLKEVKKVQVPIYAAAFSPVDDNIVVTSGEEGALRVWDVDSSSTVRIIQGHHGTVRKLAFSPRGQYVVSAGDDLSVRLWSVCNAGDKNNVRRSVVANLTTSDALKNFLDTYCDKNEVVKRERLPN